jgi:hypothetical protein
VGDIRGLHGLSPLPVTSLITDPAIDDNWPVKPRFRGFTGLRLFTLSRKCPLSDESRKPAQLQASGTQPEHAQ